MKAYIVGGAVRDRLLGRPVQDRDWVVVGETPEAMIARGFKPVGADFPVFLHPQTGEEYALARTERKSGHGYKGFTFYADASVSLEDDLIRRDLTVNAMAQDEAGTLVDPYGGQRDLKARMLRHVSAAFAEDPLRVLRLARFAARLPDFTVAPETINLCNQLVEAGELKHLTRERVWQELSRALMAGRPSRFVEVMIACGAWDAWFTEVEPSDSMQRAIDAAAEKSLPIEARFALFANVPAEVLEPFLSRLNPPRECADLARLGVNETGRLSATGTDPQLILESLQRCDALRRPERFGVLLDALAAGSALSPAQKYRLSETLVAARGVDAGALARITPDVAALQAALRAAREGAIAQSLRA